MVDSLFSRYHGLRVIDVGGRRSIEQRFGKLPVVPAGSLQHVVVGGETLDMLAARYYGTAELWWRIADANPLERLFVLQPGDALTIPPIRVATATSGG